MLRGSIGVYFVVTKISTGETSAFKQGEENMAGVEQIILQDVVQIKLEELEQHESDIRTLREQKDQKEMQEGKAVIEDTDMPLKILAQALASASRALDLYEVFDCIAFAAYIKKDFDKMHGPGWQCVDSVVGTNFSCFFNHFKGTFIYFALETLNFLIFKGISSNSTSS
ncbi:probable dynein light chain isoform X4 [Durio zibethinus]|uniref:Dynein light chain n=1 Tax=Durio zibethinus TaxID=66656 RepID=A0A6P5XQB3_DURZI|nr:probable dynein light chain isoform X4 [Durio zibethinus]